MSQKFIQLEEAATKLGVSKERLNELRESGVLRAYRDGSSWKFRTEEIEKLEAEGVPADDDQQDDLTLDAGGGYSLPDLDDDLPELSADVGESTTTADKAAEITSLGDDDEDIGLGVEPLGDGDDAESILLTGDDEIEGGLPRPQSTIIGKSELSLESDLQLAAGSDVTPEAPQPADAGGSFANLEELELDLEAESSRIHESKSKAADSAPIELEAADDDELELDLAGSDVLAGQSAPDAGATPGLSGPGSVSGLSGLEDIQLGVDEDDDLVLGGSDGSGSGIDLGSGDSGINLSPSDSGFALDEVPLDLGGSAVGSALDLAALSAASSGVSGLGSAVSGVGAEDFQLTPSDGAEDEEDSSQIVALEEVGEEDEDLPGFEAVDDGDDDLGGGFGGGMGAEAAAAPVVVGAGQDVTFPGWVVGLLGAGFVSMMLCGLMVMDLVQSMWAWDEPFSMSSSVMEGLLGIFGG